MANDLTDLHDVSTLAVTLSMDFYPVAQAYGVRLEGLEDDINVHTEFWYEVAREILGRKSGSRPPQPTGGTE